MAKGCNGELAQVGLAQQDCACVFKLGDDRSILVGHEVRQYPGTAGGAYPLGPHLVLDGDGDSVHRAADVALHDFLLGLPGGPEGLFAGDRKVGVELEVQVVDAVQVCLGSLDGGQFLGGD